MNKKGQIVLIDDDEDDLHLLIEIFADLNLPNEVHLFKNTSSVIAFLQKPEVDPFLIISDINMPVMNGFELRQVIQKDPVVNAKRIPYVFFSTATSFQLISDGTAINFQGIFRKPTKPSEWKETLATIIKYWTLSIPPDEYKI